jgi:acetoacetate decarboxylase
MKQEDVVKTAFAMPLTSPAFRPEPYRIISHEFSTITYRTAPKPLCYAASANHILTDLTLGLGTVVHGYLAAVEISQPT